MNRAIMVFILAAVCSGCVSVKSYVDPGFSTVDTQSIHPEADPLPVTLDAHFERNGKPLPEQDAYLSRWVANTLSATRVLKVVPADQAKATLTVKVNDTYQRGATISKSILTGLTQGLVGRTVDDHYLVKIELRGPKVPVRQGEYTSTVKTALGHAEVPENVAITSAGKAFGVAVQEVMLRFLKDVQTAGDNPLPLYFVTHSNQGKH